VSEIFLESHLVDIERVPVFLLGIRPLNIGFAHWHWC